jgi:heme oxygenase
MLILAQLQQKTAVAHATLERKLDLLNRCTSRAVYRHVLEQFFGFYLPVEAALTKSGAWAALGLDGAERGKAPLLAADLRSLGASAADLAQMPICTSLPQLRGMPQALGCLYVLEGATLGGQIITRRLMTPLALTPTQGCSFFASYGSQVGPMWRAFGAALTGYVTTPAVADEVIAGACATFAACERWMAARV